MKYFLVGLVVFSLVAALYNLYRYPDIRSSKGFLVPAATESKALWFAVAGPVLIIYVWNELTPLMDSSPAWWFFSLIVVPLSFLGLMLTGWRGYLHRESAGTISLEQEQAVYQDSSKAETIDLNSTNIKVYRLSYPKTTEFMRWGVYYYNGLVMLSSSEFSQEFNCRLPEDLLSQIDETSDQPAQLNLVGSELLVDYLGRAKNSGRDGVASSVG